MKVVTNVLLILAAGAAAFFSFAQSQKLADQQTIRLEKKSEEEKVRAEATAAEKERNDARAALTDATKKREDLNSAVAALKAAESSIKRDTATVDTTLATQQQELEALGKAVEELNKLLKDIGTNVTMENIGDEVAKIETNVKTKKARLEELTALIEGAEKKIVAARGESKRLSDRAVESSVRVSRNAMEAVVTAVNQDWGFLVIGAGSNSGFTPQTSLLVKRDGQFIGRVKPTSIEATQTIADIELDSLAPGVRIQPGDRVIVAQPAVN
jgi:predicted  nucleic acid-binding Zn-ribbon protein